MERSRNVRSRSYTISFKLEVLAKLEELNGNISGTAKYYCIPRSCVQDWIKQKEKLTNTTARDDVEVRKRRNIPSDNEQRKKRAKFPEMEIILVDWIHEERKAGRAVTSFQIKTQAEEILKTQNNSEESINDIDFKASNGWLERFLNRHNIVSRSVTSIGQKVPDNAKELCEKFFEFFDRTAKDINPSYIGNMDETPLWFDLPRQTTYDFKGVKSVTCKTTGKEKLRYTVVLSSMADGTKLKPMIIFRGLQNVPKADFPNDVVVTVALKGSMNAELMNIYKQKVWGARPGSFFKPKSLLVMDSAKPHLKTTVKSSFKQHYKTELAIIPGGLTPLLQPADVHWNKTFKSEIRNSWCEWLKSGEQDFTKSGKRRSASYLMIAQWVKAAWGNVPVDLVKRSFPECGLCMGRNIESLHRRLRGLLQKDELSSANDIEEGSGLTDQESEDESFSDDDV